MSYNLYTSGTTIAGTIASRTLWAETIPEGQTRFYTARIIARTDAYDYAQAWRQFTLYNDGSSTVLLDGFPEITPDFTSPALAGITIQISTTGDVADITVGEATVPVDMIWNLFLEWVQC